MLRAERASGRRRRWYWLLGLGVACALAALAWLATERQPEPDRPTLADYWAGRAVWRFERKWTSQSLGQAGVANSAILRIVDDRWYLFNRATAPDACVNGAPKMGIQVRRSDDRGRTWSNPVVALAPAPGTEWSCQATDGSVVFDAESRRWRFLFQCNDGSASDDDGGWNGCYAERKGADPMGPFSAPAGASNPVIRSADLWSQICDPGDECADATGGPGRVRGEGTFDIFRRDAAGWWFGFHGTDGRLGFRSVARTRDFSRGSFVVDDPARGLPPDAVVAPSDATAFREQWGPGGPIGAGAGSIVEEDGYSYLLAEFADLDLDCVPGQTWSLGLFRSRAVSATTWEPYPAGNPIVYSSRRPEQDGKSTACNVPYASLFQDPASGVRYLVHGRSTPDAAFDGLYLYRLEWQRNLLGNGDFWQGDTTGWKAIGATRQVVHRDPNASRDGTPYLEVACAASPCNPADATVQDQRVRPGFDGSVTFGGVVRTMGGAGSLEIVLRQLDARGAEIAADVLTANAGADWARVAREVEVDDRARTLRFELHPRTPGGFGVDDLFVEPTG